MTVTTLTDLRVALRPFGRADVTADYIGWLNDPAVVRYSNQRFRRHDRESCLMYFASFAGTANRFLSIVDRDTGRAVGTMTAYLSPHHGTADVGIMLGASEARGRGLGLAAWTLLVDGLLAEPDIRKVTAGTLACNHAMIALAERSGMTLEGRRIGQEIVEGAPTDILLFGKFADGSAGDV